MNVFSIIRTGALILIGLSVAMGCQSGEQVDTQTPASSARDAAVFPASDTTVDAPGFIYGRIKTYSGATYEGRLRWGGDEEAFWNQYFNGYKDENPWGRYLSPEQLTTQAEPIEVFGVSIAQGQTQMELGRPFMMRFGDMARIEAHGQGVRAALEQGVHYDPNVRVTLKNGTVFELNRNEAGDFDDGVRVWDVTQGIIDLAAHQIWSIDFLPTPPLHDVPDRLHGTVHTTQGTFTGFLQWDRQASTGSDQLVGRTADGALALPFDSIRTIARHVRNSTLVTLNDGREVVLAGTREVGSGNRGIYVDDPRYSRVLVSWEALERIELHPANIGPSYDAFSPGRPLWGTVLTQTGQRHTGRLVFDLDESATTETLDAPYAGIDYTLPFERITSIVTHHHTEQDAPTANVTLQSGEVVRLEHAGDLGAGNAGMLIFTDGIDQPTYVPWPHVTQIDFDHSISVAATSDPQ